jgi:uncharacterized protein
MTTARPLGWGRFLLQLITVVIAYVAGSVPAVLIWGEKSTLLALSPLGGALAGILVAWLWLRRDNAVREALALNRPANWPRAVLTAIAAAVAIIVWFQLGGNLLKWLGMPSIDTSQVIDLASQSPASLALWIVAVAWIGAGFGEEVLWRGFLLDRLMRMPGISGRLWLATGVQGVAFGLPHAYQGAAGVIITGVVGLFFGWLRTKTAWNLWPLIIAHALVDTIMLLLAYAAKVG